MADNSIKLLAGRGNPEFAKSVAKCLDLPLTPVSFLKGSGQESNILIEESVRDEDVSIVLTPTPHKINCDLMDLLIMVNACRSASARRITAILPNFPYARQDKKDKSRAPITAKLVATMLETAGCNHVITVGLHASQIQGFFSVTVDNLYAEPRVRSYIRQNFSLEDVVIVSPDAGGAKRATSIADKLGIPFALIHKERACLNEVSRVVLVGDCVGMSAILIDDMADTYGTLAKAAEVLLHGGATSVTADVTHGVLSGNAVEILNNSRLSRLVVGNTIALGDKLEKCDILKVLDLAPLVAEACRRTHNGESISVLFHTDLY